MPEVYTSVIDISRDSPGEIWFPTLPHGCATLRLMSRPLPNVLNILPAHTHICNDDGSHKHELKVQDDGGNDCLETDGGDHEWTSGLMKKDGTHAHEIRSTGRGVKFEPTSDLVQRMRILLNAKDITEQVAARTPGLTHPNELSGSFQSFGIKLGEHTPHAGPGWNVLRFIPSDLSAGRLTVWIHVFRDLEDIDAVYLDSELAAHE